MSNAFGKMWIILEPILFALIGSEVQVIQKQFGLKNNGISSGGQDRPTVSREGSGRPRHRLDLQDDWRRLRRVRGQPQQEGKDLHGLRLASQGGCSGRSCKMWLVGKCMVRIAITITIMLHTRPPSVPFSSTTRGSSTNQSGNLWDEKFSPWRCEENNIILSLTLLNITIFEIKS